MLPEASDTPYGVVGGNYPHIRLEEASDGSYRVPKRYLKYHIHI